MESYREPRSWNEMTRDQLLFWCGVLRQPLTKHEVLLMACVKFYNIPERLYMSLPEVVDLNLAWRMEWLTENALTKNVVGTVQVFFRTYS